jgi:hypothetical protein
MQASHPQDGSPWGRTAASERFKKYRGEPVTHGNVAGPYSGRQSETTRVDAVTVRRRHARRGLTSQTNGSACVGAGGLSRVSICVWAARPVEPPFASSSVSRSVLRLFLLGFAPGSLGRRRSPPGSGWKSKHWQRETVHESDVETRYRWRRVLVGVGPRAHC